MEKLKAEKIKRHLDNLRIFSGYFHGLYFLLGVAKPKLPSPHKIKNNKQGNNTPNVKR